MGNSFIVHGDIFFTPSYKRSECHEDSFLVVVDGCVVGIWKEIPAEYRALEVKDYAGMLVIPGMSDLHVHASQYQFRGIWMDEELLEWLNRHTFPEEAKYKDPSYAEKAYGIFTDDLVKTTTTRANIFATIHRQSSLILCKLLEDAGLVANVGKVNMDRNSPDILIEDTDESIRETRAYIGDVLSSCRHVKPIVTPRFIPSCTDRLSLALGEIAAEYGLPVQSHLSENLSEVDWVKELCPESSSYADAYRRLGLWGRTKTVMAHCVYSHLGEDEMMGDENIFIAHCPASNTNLASGIMPSRHFLEKGSNMGLGSDVAGGTTLSILRALTDSIQMSKLYWRLVDQSVAPLDFTAAFYLATKAGGAFFGKVGSFEPGYEADIVVLDERASRTALEGLGLHERAERYAYTASEVPVVHKAVQGRWLF